MQARAEDLLQTRLLQDASVQTEQADGLAGQPRCSADQQDSPADQPSSWESGEIRQEQSDVSRYQTQFGLQAADLLGRGPCNCTAVL